MLLNVSWLIVFGKLFPQTQCDWLVDVRFAGVIDGQLNGGKVVSVCKTLDFGDY